MRLFFFLSEETVKAFHDIKDDKGCKQKSDDSLDKVSYQDLSASHADNYSGKVDTADDDT